MVFTRWFHSANEHRADKRCCFAMQSAFVPLEKPKRPGATTVVVGEAKTPRRPASPGCRAHKPTLAVGRRWQGTGQARANCLYRARSPARATGCKPCRGVLHGRRAADSA